MKQFFLITTSLTTLLIAQAYGADVTTDKTAAATVAKSTEEVSSPAPVKKPAPSTGWLWWSSSSAPVVEPTPMPELEEKGEAPAPIETTPAPVAETKEAEKEEVVVTPTPLAAAEEPTTVATPTSEAPSTSSTGWFWWSSSSTPATQEKTEEITTVVETEQAPTPKEEEKKEEITTPSTTPAEATPEAQDVGLLWRILGYGAKATPAQEPAQALFTEEPSAEKLTDTQKVDAEFVQNLFDDTKKEAEKILEIGDLFEIEEGSSDAKLPKAKKPESGIWADDTLSLEVLFAEEAKLPAFFPEPQGKFQYVKLQSKKKQKGKKK